MATGWATWRSWARRRPRCTPRWGASHGPLGSTCSSPSGKRAGTQFELLKAAAVREAAGGVAILVKGSRSMQMERVVEALCAKGDGDAL